MATDQLVPVRHHGGPATSRSLKTTPGVRLRGAVTVPADKSISHRAAILGAFANGTTEISNYLDAGDTRSTLEAVRGMGAGLTGVFTDRLAPTLRVSGFGLRGPRESEVDCGNASTLARLVLGLLAGQDGRAWTLDGDESIRTRPQRRVAEPLTAMGATVGTTDGRLPIRVIGRPLTGMEHRLAVASAQVKSCLLFAGLLADGPTTVIESVPARDHSETMLAAFGADLESGTNEAGLRWVTVNPADRLEATSVTVPGDMSSAAFFLVGATLISGSEVRLKSVGMNPTRTGLINILQRMGAQIEIGPLTTNGGEPVADLVVRSACLTATEVLGDEVPSTIDELPLVALLGCFAEGETVVRGAQELRAKESDRIDVVVNGLRGLGADIDALEDGFVVRGRGIRGGVIDSHKDHRIAMLGALAGLVSRDGVEVVDMQAAGISYRGFEADLASIAV